MYKRFNFYSDLLNDTHKTISSTLEALSSHADLRTRRACALTEEVASKVNQVLQKHQQLAWVSECCRSIEIDPSKL